MTGTLNRRGLRRCYAEIVCCGTAGRQFDSALGKNGRSTVSSAEKQTQLDSRLAVEQISEAALYVVLWFEIANSLDE